MEDHYPFREIRDFLSKHYDPNDLEIMFFDITGEGTDTLGSFPRELLAQKIYTYCQHRDIVPRLLAEMKHTREKLYMVCFPQFQNPDTPSGLPLKPAKTEVQADEVPGINPSQVQKQGGYQIDAPPEGWKVNELTPKELYLRDFGPEASQIICQQGIKADLERREIMEVVSPVRLTIEFDPGVSMINGRNTLVFVPEEKPMASLRIIPVDQNSAPPNFLGQSIVPIFMQSLTGLMNISNLKSLTTGITGNTNHLKLTAELEQKIENVTVNGRPDQSLTANQTLITIPGYSRDYLLVLNYIWQATTETAEIENQKALLKSFVDSFRVIRPSSISTEERQYKALGNRRYKNYIQLNGASSIMTQIALLSSQWKALDWDKAESKQHLISDIRRIKKAIKVFAIKNQELTNFLKSFDGVEGMNSQQLNDLFNPQ